MDPGIDDRLRKHLTANDLGVTGSHQAGIHVPKDMAGFFPQLERGRVNPDAWLSVEIWFGHTSLAVHLLQRLVVWGRHPK